MASDKEGLLERPYNDESSSSLDLESETAASTKFIHNETLPTQRPQRRRSCPSFLTLCTIISTIISIATISMLATLFQKPTLLSTLTHTDKPVWKECGLNSTTARHNGCHFDLMLSAWIHHDCYDRDLMESYLSAQNYTWYGDSELTMPISDAVIRLGDHEQIFVEREFHYVHCAYMWEMQMRAWTNGKAVDQHIWDEEHSSHCGKLLVQHVLPRNFTRLTVGFDPCGVP